MSQRIVLSFLFLLLQCFFLLPSRKSLTIAWPTAFSCFIGFEKDLLFPAVRLFPGDCLRAMIITFFAQLPSFSTSWMLVLQVLFLLSFTFRSTVDMKAERCSLEVHVATKLQRLLAHPQQQSSRTGSCYFLAGSFSSCGKICVIHKDVRCRVCSSGSSVTVPPLLFSFP